MCFGLAHSGEEIKDIVSLHGVYDSPKLEEENKIESLILYFMAGMTH